MRRLTRARACPPPLQLLGFWASGWETGGEGDVGGGEPPGGPSSLSRVRYPMWICSGGVTEKPLQSKCKEKLPWGGDTLGWEDQFIMSSARKRHQRHQLSTPCLLVLQA